MTPERLWQFARLGSSCLTPDGSAVAYAVRHYNLAENQGRSEIHLFELASQQDRVLVADLKVADALQFATTAQGLRLLYVGLPAGGDPSHAAPQVWSVALADRVTAAGHERGRGCGQSEGLSHVAADRLHQRRQT